MITKKLLAREWLYFVSFVFVGITFIPALVFFFFASKDYAQRHNLLEVYGVFWGAISAGRTDLKDYLLIFCPYILFQFIRSIIWAYKTYRE